jgi:signal transduction histidine kinase
LKKISSLLILFLFHLFCNGQALDIAQIKSNWLKIDSILSYKENGAAGFNKYDPKTSIAVKNFFKQHEIEFSLTNSGAQTTIVHLFIGHWLQYTATINGVPVSVTPTHVYAIGNKIPLLKIAVPDHETIVINVKPDVRKFNYGYLKFIIIKEGFANEFAYAYYLNNQKIYLIISFVFLGILLVMALYATISWYRSKSVDYFYYGMYVLFFIIYFLVRISTMFITNYALLQHNLYAIHLFQVGGYIFYSLFIISFIQLKVQVSFLYKILKTFNYIMIGYLIFDAFIIYFTNYINVSISFFVIIRYGLLTLSLVAIIFLFLLKGKQSNYVAYGILFLFLFGLVSLTYSPISFDKAHFFNFFDMRIPWYQLGIFIELVLFTMALQYKTNMLNKQQIMAVEQLKVENEKKEFETFMVIMETKEKERTRIAQEIHDDIGAGLTNIRLLSEIAKGKNVALPMGEIDKISSSASELIENMNEIIWSINSKNDTLSNLIAYIRRYVVSYFEINEAIVVKTQIPEIIPTKQVSGEFRRSVFLTIKEALHNIMKHADATMVNLNMSISDQKLFITIMDNGKGIDTGVKRAFSNGLKNMKERIENLGGQFLIQGHRGTIITMELPI